ncbi:MAG: exosortase/archaeosortase family protein [Phycisphaerae bacterium]|nr:exosortase/archaeosortase family protein [Phycisphaerae bacterium]
MAVRPATIPTRHEITFDRPVQMRAAVVGAAFIATFWYLLDFIPPVGGLVHAWVYEADWSHGPLIPVFSAYLIYLKWDRIRRCLIRYTWVGLLIMLGGLGLYIWALSGQLLFAYAKPFSLMVSLLGLIIFLCGLPVMYYAWLPWLFLFFAIPLPPRLYFAWTNPLRKLAAEVTSALLSLWPGLHIERNGSILEYVYQGTSGVIGVADACSGMRSTVTLCALGVAVACMSERPLWHRLLLVASCIPIATFCNFIRVTITCWLHIFIDPKYATGSYHTMLGLLIILLAFGIFSGLGWVLNNIFVEESEPEEATG